MSQLINLYQPILRAQPKVFSVQTMLQTLLVILVALACLYVYARWQSQGLNAELAQLRAQHETLMKRIEDFNREHPARQKSAQLEQEVARLGAEVAAKTRALAILASGVQGNTTGFSAHLEGLARQRLPDLWLTGIRIEAGGEELSLNGSALQPELVPRFLQQLGNEPSFRGKEFSIFQMARAANDAARIDFSLQTRATPTEKTP